MSIITLREYEDRVEMSNDTIITFPDGRQTYQNNLKVQNRGDMLIGMAATLEVYQAGILYDIYELVKKMYPKKDYTSDKYHYLKQTLTWRFKSKGLLKEVNGYPDIEAAILVYYKNSGIIEVTRNLEILKKKDFAAIGSGYKQALGALYSDSCTKIAAYAAMEYEVTCGGTVETTILEK